MSEDRLYAVISGDIVQSRRYAEQGPAIRDTITDAYAECAQAFDALSEMPRVDVFAGDSWQMLVPSPAPALRIGLCMRALIRSSDELPKADTRLAIGLGTVDFLDEESVSQSQGAAFTLSGEALDGLQDSKVRMAVQVPKAWSERGGLLEPQATVDAMMALVDAICVDWTAAVSGAAAGRLRGLTQTEIAEMAGISQPAVSKALAAGHWTAIDRQVQWWEGALG
jgi:hypothetical protein